MTVPKLGDCLLHRTHHMMTQECWRRVLTFHVEHPDRDDLSTRDQYKFAYERACLDDLACSPPESPQL